MSTTRPSNQSRRTAASRRRSAGFTLTEMLVAVGALALLSLGVAQVFSITTRTVAAGRKLSNLNAAASAVERQMRADFGRMTSRGVMVIRNERANGGGTVESFAADPLPRVRRIDEIIFSATGRFASERQPVTVGGQPVSSSEALIYYGHGARQQEGAAGSSGFDSPVNISDVNNAGATPLGVPQGAGGSKVNLYASEWTLARRAFLLAPPNTAATYSAAQGQGLGAGAYSDSVSQIGGLPAVASPSRGDNLYWSSDSTVAPLMRGGGLPVLASGAVDIIAMDLRGILGQLATVNLYNFGAESNMRGNAAQQQRMGVGASGRSTAEAQQDYLSSILPAASNVGRRMRVEPAAPDFTNAGGGAPANYQRTDQLMLTTGAFLPRCTEFIVEYSFGLTADSTINPAPSQNGGLIWHGLERRSSAGGQIDVATDTVRYTDFVNGMNGAPARTFFARRPVPGTGNTNTRTSIAVQPELIEPTALFDWNGSNNGWNYDNVTSYAMFGPINPFYSPIPATGNHRLTRDVNNNGKYDWADGDVLADPESIPWKWPTLIRVTLSIADPTDPSVEQTFQFIFEVPADQRTGAL